MSHAGSGYGDVKKRGYWWHAYFEVLNEIVSNWNNFLAKVDTDTGDTTFRNDYDVSTPTIGDASRRAISRRAFPEGDFITLLKNLRTNFNDALDAFAADDGINGTTIFTNEKFSSTGNPCQANEVVVP